MAAHRDGIVLVFARTETRMFFDSVWPKANGIYFLKGRVAFCLPGGAQSGEAGAPSVLISYDPPGSRRNYEALRACDLGGHFLRIR